MRNDTEDQPLQNIAYLSLGSNLGDREDNLRDAVNRLSGAGRVMAASSLYQTEPVEFTEQPIFLNCALALETALTPEQLMRSLLAIEKEMGRVRREKKGPRLIDLDILLFGDRVVSSANLVIPHPAMQERRFVLEPLHEIASEVLHPVCKKTIGELLKELPPGQRVKRIKSLREVTAG